MNILQQNQGEKENSEGKLGGETQDEKTDGNKARDEQTDGELHDDKIGEPSSRLPSEAVMRAIEVRDMQRQFETRSVPRMREMMAIMFMNTRGHPEATQKVKDGIKPFMERYGISDEDIQKEIEVLEDMGDTDSEPPPLVSGSESDWPPRIDEVD